MLVVGGITRLTQSGLSMVDWQPIMGTLPPTSTAEWQEAFEQYKQYPEYQQLNPDMTLSEFKTIYYWEYLHRLLGRLTGIVFLVPFIWFWVSGRFNRKLKIRSVILLILGAGQGLMGWIMVKSGLANVPHVSHYRLAIHLVLAFVLFAFCCWYALDLYKRRRIWLNSRKIYRSLRRWIIGVGILIVLQVIWGAYTAGLNAGYMYNTFPKMQGQWIPAKLHSLTPLLLNYLENPVTVQWVHRVIGTLIGVGVILLWIRGLLWNLDRRIQLRITVLLVFVLIQYLLGVTTLIYAVPIALGVLHQAFAMLLWGAWIYLLHQLVHEIRALSS